MLMNKLISLFALYFIVYAKDSVTFDFLKAFVINEQKPTILISKNLCWQWSKTISLTKDLFNIGATLSSEYKDNCHLHNQYILFLVDLECSGSEAVFNNPKHLRSPYRWLVLSSHQNQSQIQQLWNLPLLADSDFILAIRNGDNFTFTELHKASPNGTTYSTPRGQYDGSYFNFKDIRPHRELFRRRRDVMGHPLTMSNVIQDSNSTQYHLPREDRLELQYDSIAKISWMHVHIAFQMLNATPRYIFSHRWGYRRQGQWSGMINDLNTGRADLGTNCVAVSERLSVVVFTDSIAKFKVKFVLRQPPLSYVSNIFTLPFSINVWIAIIISLIISTVTISLATKWEAYQLGTDQTQLDGSVTDAILLTMSALSQQGCSKEPKRLSGRVMLLVVFTALMALYAAYSANIVVLLQAPSNAIKTLEQLAHSKMTLAALEVDYNHFVLKAAKDPVRMSIYKKIEPEKGKPQFYNLDEGVERLRQGIFAFHSIVEPVYRHIEETFLETEKCDLIEIDFMNAPDPFVPVYKHSPYLELLRVAFKRIHESGIQMAQHKRLQVPKPKCTDAISTFSSVGIQNLRPVLLFMVYGIGFAILILLAEILAHQIRMYVKVESHKLNLIHFRLSSNFTYCSSLDDCCQDWLQTRKFLNGQHEGYEILLKAFTY